MGLSPVVQGPYLLLFGTRPAPAGREIVMARMAVKDLGELSTDRWEFLLEATGPVWGHDPRGAAGLFQGIGTEFTVSPDPWGEGWLCLYTPGGIAPEIHLRRAPRPEGPWGEPRSLSSCPEGADPDLYCYGAKLHPECRETEGAGLWMTYTVNTRDAWLPPGDLAKPRWVWIGEAPQERQR
jgi:hypothetical protein